MSRDNDTNPYLYWCGFKFWFSFIFVIVVFMWADLKGIEGDDLKMIHFFGILLIIKKLIDKYISD